MRSWLILTLSLALAAPAFAAEDDEVNYLDLAALMLRDGNLDRALVALDQVDLEDEGLDRTRYYTLRGMTHLRRGEAEPAASALEEASKGESVDDIVWVYLAQAYFQLERYRDVVNTLDRAGPALDRIAAVYHMRAQCHWLLEEPAMALAVLDQASRVFEEDSSFLRRKVFFLVELRLFREAVDEGKRYLAQTDGKLEDYLAIGNALRSSGSLDEAARFLEEAHLRYPGNENVTKVLAHTYIDREQLAPAADLIHEAALLNPDLVGEAAELYRRAGQPYRALTLNGQVLDQETKLKQRLALLLELKQFAQAAAMEDALLRTGLLQDEDIRYALAYAHFMVGNYELTETHLAQLTRPDLFRKAAELRRSIQDCQEDSWKCL